MSFNGRAIYIPAEETKFARVDKLEEGEVVRQQRVHIDDLLDSLLSLMSVSQRIKYLLNQNDFIPDVLIPMISTLDLKSASLHQLLRYLSINISKSTEDEKLQISKLFQTFSNYFVNVELDIQETLDLYKGLSISLKESADAKQSEELFLHLISNLDLAGEASDELVELVIDTILNTNNPAKKQLLSRIALKHQPQHIVCSSPILPKGTLTYQEDNRGNYILAIEVEPQKRDVQFYQTTFENVGHPRLIFVFTVDKSKHAKASLFAVKDPVIKATTKLYHYPFANVYGNGGCCWPELSDIQIEDPVQLANIVHLYFNSPHNNHLYGGQNLRELLTELTDKDFNDSKLKPFGTTFGNQLGMIKENKKLTAVETA